MKLESKTNRGFPLRAWKTATKALMQSMGKFRAAETVPSTWRGQSPCRDGRQGQTELGRGLSKALSVWCFVSVLILEDWAREEGTALRCSACGYHDSAINGSPAAPGCQGSSRHHVRLSGPGGTKNGASVRLEASSCLIHGRVHGHCG